MPLSLLLAVALLGQLSTAPHTAKGPHPRHHHVVRHHRHRRHLQRYGVTPAMMHQVAQVNMCEEGGNWHVNGPTYFGGLGWLDATWAEFRKPAWPSDMADAPPLMQANAMFRFVWHYGIGMPDQGGCTGGY
jgi:hypothetical protein